MVALWHSPMTYGLPLQEGRGTGSHASFPSAPVTSSPFWIWPLTFFGSFLAETIWLVSSYLQTVSRWQQPHWQFYWCFFNGLLASCAKSCPWRLQFNQSPLHTSVLQPTFLPTSLILSFVCWCPDFGWDRVNFLPSCWCNAVFWIKYENNVDNTLVFRCC